jgi:hypothetical protein
VSTVAAPRTAVLGPLRDWMRTTGTTAAARIYAHGLPATPTFPCVSLTKVGLSPDGTATERTLIQADCWAAKGQAAAAEALAAEIKTVLEQAAPGTAMGTVRLMGASIEAEAALPDPDDGTPRYAVTALVTTKVAT